MSFDFNFSQRAKHNFFWKMFQWSLFHPLQQKDCKFVFSNWYCASYDISPWKNNSVGEGPPKLQFTQQNHHFIQNTKKDYRKHIRNQNTTSDSELPVDTNGLNKTQILQPFTLHKQEQVAWTVQSASRCGLQATSWIKLISIADMEDPVTHRDLVPTLILVWTKFLDLNNKSENLTQTHIYIAHAPRTMSVYMCLNEIVFFSLCFSYTFIPLSFSW